MTTLHLTLLGAVRELTAVELPAVVSVHNGRSLRRFALELHVPDERHEELDAELRAASAANGTHIQGTDATWRVSEDWTAVSQGRRPEIYIYKAEIQEVEELHVSALEIEGLTLVPIRYREDVNEETITATLVTEVSDEDNERLDELLTKTHEFFDVIRRGISDEPLRMRFGRRVWQRAGEGSRRHNLVLIADEDKSRAAPDPLWLANQPQLDRTMEKACANTNALTLLLEELQSKGVLDKDAFHAIKHAATAHPLTHQEKSELSRTDRLDDYWR